MQQNYTKTQSFLRLGAGTVFDPFPPTELSCPVLIWEEVTSLIATWYVGWYPFCEGKRRRNGWGGEEGKVEEREASIGMKYIREESILKIKKGPFWKILLASSMF